MSVVMDGFRVIFWGYDIERVKNDWKSMEFNWSQYMVLTRYSNTMPGCVFGGMMGECVWGVRLGVNIIQPRSTGSIFLKYLPFAISPGFCFSQSPINVNVCEL